MKRQGYLLVNFGGPRSLQEVESFLTALLTDPDVIRTPLPLFLHNWLLRRIAKKRVGKATEEYKRMGGKSPIWEDTEYVASYLRRHLSCPVLTFHRYIPATHAAFLQEIENLECDEIRVFPLFPQFTYATTGSIARFFRSHLSPIVASKLRWVKNYEAHPLYIESMARNIKESLAAMNLEERETFFLFSAHGLPQSYVRAGDPYAQQCQATYEALCPYFPEGETILCYQSKFGPGKWLMPYTKDISFSIRTHTNRKKCLFIPLSFTSDHIETLIEIEEQYMLTVREKGIEAYRAPALNRREDWLASIQAISFDLPLYSNHCLIRHDS